MIISTSSQTRSLNLDNASTLTKELGRANYSYTIAKQKFLDAFASAGILTYDIKNPAIYSPRHNSYDLDILASIHLAFYPPESLRLLKGAINIICFAWEFSTIAKTPSTTAPHAFADPISMLNLVNGVWTPSNYAKAVIEREIGRPVTCIPAPIESTPASKRERLNDRGERQVNLGKRLAHIRAVPLCIWPPNQTEANRLAAASPTRLLEVFERVRSFAPSALVYLTVFNPHDARKGVGETLEAFVRFAQAVPNALLILKTSSHDDTQGTINGRLLSHQVARSNSLASQLVSGNILIINDTLTREEMNLLYDISDFYLCTSRAEGQNLPLLEAMGRGCVPVSVDHTAMSDYINTRNSIVIDSKKEPLPFEISQKYGLYGADWFTATPQDIYQSLSRTATMSRSEYHYLSERSYHSLTRGFAPSVIVDKAIKAIEELH